MCEHIQRNPGAIFETISKIMEFLQFIQFLVHHDSLEGVSFFRNALTKFSWENVSNKSCAKLLDITLKLRNLKNLKDLFVKVALLVRLFFVLDILSHFLSYLHYTDGSTVRLIVMTL